MSKTKHAPAIQLRGVRQHNLKHFDLDLPLGRLIVVTGLSGSGKSSLAFDTLYAEGQRRYIETFSPYARQFFDRMDRPQVDRIEGIPPAIAIEQRNAVKTTRSTVGTMTELCDYLKLLWPHLATLYCRQCGQPVKPESPRHIWEHLWGKEIDFPTGAECLIAFDLLLSEKMAIQESLNLVANQGFQRLLIDGEIRRIEEAAPLLERSKSSSLTVIQDRLKLAPAQRARFIESCEQAYHFGKGKLTVRFLQKSPGESASKPGPPHFFSNRFHCAPCNLDYREPSPALFSFNHPLGACPACRGFGRTMTIDYDRAIPDRSKTLADGAVRPWQSGVSAECQDDLILYCRKRRVPTDVPFERLSPAFQDWVLNGDPDYGRDKQHEWPHAWYGVKGYFRWLESRAYKMHVRVLLSRYRAYQTCPQCHGQRFQPEPLLFKIELPESAIHLSLADFYRLTVRDAMRVIESLAKRHHPLPRDPLRLVLDEVRSRLHYLDVIGLGYLTLDRPTRTLSGGETERVNLTTCLGTRLVNTLFVLDEPSVGLHPRDTERLVRILERLRDAGNTVVVVEHEASVMRAADQIVDLGPGHGESGGQVVFQGSYRDLLKSRVSLTGQYLSGRRQIELPARRPVRLGFQSEPRRPAAGVARAASAAFIQAASPCLTIEHARRHNLKNLSLQIPLGRFVCVTGVSGSGKSTLIREVLAPALEARLHPTHPATRAGDASDEEVAETEAEAFAGKRNAPALRLTGWDALSQVVMVDQSLLSKTPRSNPALYIGAFDEVRELFALSEAARQRGLNASAFSFNSPQGQCQRCRGAGFEKIEMQFLSDVFVRCPDCNGRRYRPHVLEIELTSPDAHVHDSSSQKASPRSWSIADLLDATVDEAVGFLAGFAQSRPAKRAVQKLQLLQEVGLGYLRLGQPLNTLSGGESQRLKLVSHLAEVESASSSRTPESSRAARPLSPEIRVAQQRHPTQPMLFLFDEPTTGLHFDDVRVLLKVFQRLVDVGHSVLVIEHNLDVVKSADWVIDLGPEAGDEGGQLVAQGTPEQIAACPASHTGRALKEIGIGRAES